MKDIYDYIKLPLSNRQEHLKLEEECYSRNGQSMYQKGLLAHVLDTTVPKGRKVFICHACHNGECDNPNHIYWGTPQENYNDYISNGGLTFCEKISRKYTKKQISAIAKKASKLGSQKGGKNNTRLKSDEHKRKISKSLKKEPL